MKMKAPILIRSITGRNGTNFLLSLLCRHSGVCRAQVHEDYLLSKADHLREYAEAVTGRWKKSNSYTGPYDGSASDLLHRIGDALLDYTGASLGPDKRMVMKTPALCDIDMAQRLFPEGQIVFIIRDPRSVVESLLRIEKQWGLNRTREQLARTWAARSRELADFLTRNQASVREGRIFIVRYEALVSNPRPEIARIFETLNLEIDDAFLDELVDHPVIGSSYESMDEKGRVSFQPIPKPEGFDPLCRYAHWTPYEHKIFNRICGTQMRNWGYEPISEATAAES